MVEVVDLGQLVDLLRGQQTIFMDGLFAFELVAVGHPHFLSLVVTPVDGFTNVLLEPHQLTRKDLSLRHLVEVLLVLGYLRNCFVELEGVLLGNGKFLFVFRYFGDCLPIIQIIALPSDHANYRPHN